MADTPFKLFDDDGGLLVVRPDNTLPIVRLVSARMASGDLPLRLRYEAPVVREQPRLTGGSRQFTQLGYELIGEGGSKADEEIVGLALSSLKALGLDDWHIVCGSVRPFKDVLALANDAALSRDALKLVHANNFIDLDDRVAASGVSPAWTRSIAWTSCWQMPVRTSARPRSCARSTRACCRRRRTGTSWQSASPSTSRS